MANYNYNTNRRDKNGLKLQPFSFWDFVKPAVENLFSTQCLFEFPNSDGSLDNDYKFTYTIGYHQSRLESQSEAFANYMINQRDYSIRFRRTTVSNQNSDYKILQEVYKYSFFKMLYFIHQYREGSSQFILKDTVIFHGHFVILDAFRRAHIRFPQYDLNYQVTKTLNFDSKFYSSLVDTVPLLKEISDNNGYISEFETVLHNINHAFPDIYLTQVVRDTSYSSEQCPIGNCCFRNNNYDYYYTVNHGNSFSNYPSVFLNLATFINVSSETTLDSGLSVYRRMETSRLSKVTTLLEVFSVTGCTGISEVYRYPTDKVNPINPVHKGPNPPYGSSGGGNNNIPPNNPEPKNYSNPVPKGDYGFNGSNNNEGPPPQGEGPVGEIIIDDQYRDKQDESSKRFELQSPNVNTYNNTMEVNLNANVHYTSPERVLTDPAFVNKSKLIRKSVPAFIGNRDYCTLSDKGFEFKFESDKIDDAIVNPSSDELRVRLTKLEKYITILKSEVQKNDQKYTAELDFLKAVFDSLTNYKPVKLVDIHIVQEITNIKIININAVNSMVNLVA